MSDKTSPSYAPSVFASEPEAKEAKASKKTFAEAMARLFKARKIRVVPFGPASKMRSKIVEVEADEDTATVLPFPTASNGPSNALPTPSNAIPTGCAPTPPITPGPLEAGKRALEADARSNGRAEGITRAREKPRPRLRVIGDCPADTICLHCFQAGDVKRVVNASVVGGKSETLHESCAVAWFDRLAGVKLDADESDKR